MSFEIPQELDRLQHQAEQPQEMQQELIWRERHGHFIFDGN